MQAEMMLEKLHASKSLGIYLDQGLTRGSHIDTLSAQLSSGIFVLVLWLNISLRRYY